MSVLAIVLLAVKDIYAIILPPVEASKTAAWVIVPQLPVAAGNSTAPLLLA